MIPSSESRGRLICSRCFVSREDCIVLRWGWVLQSVGRTHASKALSSCVSALPSGRLTGCSSMNFGYYGSDRYRFRAYHMAGLCKRPSAVIMRGMTRTRMRFRNDIGNGKMVERACHRSQRGVIIWLEGLHRIVEQTARHFSEGPRGIFNSCGAVPDRIRACFLMNFLLSFLLKLMV